MNKEMIKALKGLMIFAAVIVLVVLHFEKVIGAIGVFIGMLRPFILGGALAFVINLPMRTIEDKLFGKKEKSEKWKRPVSFILALLLVAFVIWAVFMLIIPQLGATIRELAVKVPAFINEMIAVLINVFDNNPEIQEYIAGLNISTWDWNNILSKVANVLGTGIGSVLISTVNVATGIFGVVFDLVISFVFAVYLLLQKENLARQRDSVLKAYLPEHICKRIQKILKLLHKNFANFISSQCLEALILGAMFVIVMSIFRFPYALLIGTLIAVTALVPIVGAFIGCAVGAFLILVENPIMAVSFVIMFLVLQQVEGNLIYPRVVGSSVGLPAIWVLVAVSVGGSLFGIIGMLIFIPIISTLYTLLREDVSERNAGKTRMEEIRDDSAFEDKTKSKAAEPVREAAEPVREAAEPTRKAAEPIGKTTEGKRKGSRKKRK